jgi:hypothetical protein
MRAVISFSATGAALQEFPGGCRRLVARRASLVRLIWHRGLGLVAQESGRIEVMGGANVC